MKKTVTALALALMCTAPAYANEMSKEEKIEWKTNHYMGKIDSNGDGSISRAEHEAFGTKMFGDADSNGDGKITKAELKAEKSREYEDMKAAKGE